MRLGIGAARPEPRPPPAAWRSRCRGARSTPVCSSSTGFGRPVVPEVSWTSATLGSKRRSPGAPGSEGRPPSPTTTTGRSSKRSTCSGVVTMTDGSTASTTWARSDAPRRGLSGTYTPPARHTANRAATTSALGSITPTGAPGSTPASSRRSAISVARSRTSASVWSRPPACSSSASPSSSPPKRRSASESTSHRPLGVPLLGEGARALLLVGVAPHRHQLGGAGPARVGEARARARPAARAWWRPSPPASSWRSSRPAPGPPRAAARAGRRSR